MPGKVRGIFPITSGLLVELFFWMARSLLTIYPLLASVRLAHTFITTGRVYHRLRGSASPALTATHHSYGSPRLSDFFSLSALGVRPSTEIHAKWLKRRVFTQGCAFCSKSRYFSYPMISRPPKRLSLIHI